MNSHSSDLQPADPDLIALMDIGMRISQLDDEVVDRRRRETLAQPLWRLLYSHIDAFLFEHKGVSPGGCLNGYLEAPFEEWVTSPDQIINKDLCWATLMIDGGMNHGQFRQYCPDQGEGVLFGELKQMVAQARSLTRSEEAAQTLYREIRFFMTVNPTVASQDLDAFVRHLATELVPAPQVAPDSLMQRVRDYIQKAYLHIDTPAAPNFEVVCEHCQSPAPRGGDGRPKCLGSHWHTTLVGHGVEPRDPAHDRVLTPRLLTDITGPGRAEVELYQDVLDMGLRVELYPGIDACDVSFEVHGRPFHVDLKCWTTPAQLKEKILSAGLPRIEGASSDTFYIVVPDEIAKQPNYISDLRGWLGQEARAHAFLNLKHIMTHTEFMTHVREIF